MWYFSLSGSYPTLDFFRKIDNFIGPQLTTLANIIGEQSAKKQQRYFIYYSNNYLLNLWTLILLIFITILLWDLSV